jgi:tartrate dehydrogenase/decarboxylase/D-malate dehydrogenase
MRYAFELARSRGKKHVTSATKSNGIIFTRPFWDQCFPEIAADDRGVRTDQYHIHILTAHFARHPDWFDLVVGSNLFGRTPDIGGSASTEDLGEAIASAVSNGMIRIRHRANTGRTYYCAP